MHPEEPGSRQRAGSQTDLRQMGEDLVRDRDVDREDGGDCLTTALRAEIMTREEPHQQYFLG